MTEVSLPVPPRISQATAIEQSRAIAEVQAAVVVAQQCPRNIQSALAAMRQSCGMKTLAERAFFAFPRGGSTVSGETVYLARELARCWGNIQYGVSELSRDDTAGRSEMQAFAWDLEHNTRATFIFLVPHKRDKAGKNVPLVDLRDIYENNANLGARRVREAIFAVLPPWYVEEAKDICNRTLADGGGIPRPQRIANMLAHFGSVGVTEGDLTRKLGRPSGEWTDHDIGQLGVLFKSLQRHEISRDEAFPPPVVTAAEITTPPASNRKKTNRTTTPPDAEPAPASTVEEIPEEYAADVAALNAEAAAEAAR